MRAAVVADFASWRRQARALLHAAVPPEDIEWQAPGDSSLFDAEQLPDGETSARIPRALASLLEATACHADPDRWALMYRLLWRVTRGSHRALLEDHADADVARLTTMAKAVDREVHKMHAFVRFKEGESGLYEAWFEPEHDILRRAAPFFRDRFASMRWIIATPRGAAHWDGEAIEYLDAPMTRPAASEDAKEALWRTYYASIFNPARLNPKLMRQHMPRRYWKNLPEAQDIVRMSQPRDVLQAPVAAPRWAGHVHVDVPAPTELQSCRRCPLWEHATQAVPGEGPAAARLMLVGEQPGDEEDLKGRPFVGPAGKVLERALLEAGIARDAIYLTNAVKHFKWEPRGKRRLHKTPAQREIEACQLWLDREMADVKPEVIVAMGATAALALTGERLSIAKLRTMQMRHASGARLIVTYHPSAILRGEERADALFEALCEDLRRAAAV
ncbi:MAG TPA: UdgX family uracil-DNA binding protein [Usitatibacter sp.]|nr:UdgX family uracil-DNA binding protein [Usitatibacter sp.]